VLTILCQTFKLWTALIHCSLLLTRSIVQKNFLSQLYSKCKFPCFKFVCKRETGGKIREGLSFYAPICTASVSVLITTILNYFGGGIKGFVLKWKIKYQCALRQQQSRSVWISSYLSEQGLAYVAVVICVSFAGLLSDGRKPMNGQFAKGSIIHIKSPQIVQCCSEMKSITKKWKYQGNIMSINIDIMSSWTVFHKVKDFVYEIPHN